MEGVVLCKDSAGKNQVEIIPYRSIKCVNPLGRHSFFFKSQHKGYAFFFNGQEAQNSMKWFEALIVLIDKDVETKEKLKIFDLTDTLTEMELTSETCQFKFSFTLQVKLDMASEDKKKEKA